MDVSILDRIQQSFAHVPDFDPRAKLSPKAFLVTLVFALISDTKSRSLDCIRRFLIAQSGVAICRSTFWQRMASKRLLHLLLETVSQLMKNLASINGIDLALSAKIGVAAIFYIDSSSVSLPAAAKKLFPAPRRNVVPAAFKWHLCMNLLTSTMKWWKMTPATSHDRKSFPPLTLLKGTLIIFDLGYWDYTLLSNMIADGCFFLSRVKGNAVIDILEVIKGLKKRKFEGTLLFDHKKIRKGKKIVELIGSFGSQAKRDSFQARVIGFWNRQTKSYYWYVTNLAVPAELIYPIYRLRWQVELIFKSGKSSLSLADAPSANQNIIKSMLLVTIIATLISQPLAKAMLATATSDKQMAASVQRAAMVLVHVCVEFMEMIMKGCRLCREKLICKLKTLEREIFDPNYKRRETSLKRVARLAEEYA